MTKTNTRGRPRRRIAIRAIALALALASLGMRTPAFAQSLNVAYVNVERVMRDSAPALAAQKRLDDEFGARDREIRQLEETLQAERTALARPGEIGGTERPARQRDADSQTQRLQKLRRDFAAELDARRSVETGKLFDTMVRAIRDVSQEKHLDIVLQDVVWIRPEKDFTSEVIERLAKP